ncbi:MAG: prepilin-type N-terminal cleavage/methylation domain-containing protein [Rhodoferax sp.]
MPPKISSIRLKTTHDSGFTLIELLIVLSLLALLLSIAVPRYMYATDSAKEKVRAQNLATLRDALDKFTADQGRYPAELNELVARRYLHRLPVDPVTGSEQWEVVPDPRGSLSGVYDVRPPVSKAGDSDIAEVAPTTLPAGSPEDMGRDRIQHVTTEGNSR